jgi:hypothetical protein
MPIALLLHEVTAAFRYGARVLNPWNHLVQVEELLIDRARSAFLFKWFGTALPLKGFHVRVAIANIGELRERYEKVKAEVRKRAEGPNLTEPIFGMAGVAAGMILTPGVALGTTIAIVRSLDWQIGTLAAVLQGVLSFLAILISPFVGGIVVALSPLLAAGGFVGYLQMGVANAPELRAIFDLLGGLARLLDAATRFIKLLLGPRSEVKNPVLAGLLHLFDQLARLFPLGLALIAVLVTRLGPLLLPLVATIKAMGELVSAILDTLKFMLNNFVEQLKDVFTGPDNIVSPLKSMLARFTKVFSKIVPTFNDLLDKATAILLAWYKDVQKQVEDWGKLLGDKSDQFKHLKELIKKDPTLVKIDRLIDAFKLAGKILGRPSEKKTGEQSESTSLGPLDPWVESAKKWAAEAEKAGKAMPDLPEIETPGDMMERLGLKKEYGIPDEKMREKWIEKAKKDQPPVSKKVTDYVKRARYPTSAFEYEKKALAAEYGAKTLPEALSKARAEEMELRNALEAVIGRVLPPELRYLMISLYEGFETFDETVTLDKKKPAKKTRKKEVPKKELPFPVKDLPPDNGLLKPVIHRLFVHSKSGRREDLRDFSDMLRKELDQPYPALN